MSGRGRGRGKKYTPPSGAALFLRRSLDECGLGAQNLRGISDITRPALFPPISLHSSGDQRLLMLEQQQARQKEEEEAMAAAAMGGDGTSSAGGGAGGGGPQAIKAEGGVSSSAVEGAGAGDGGGGITAKPLRTIARSAQTLALIGKSREMHHRLQNSVHYVRPSKDVPDVIRYSERGDMGQYDDADDDGGFVNNANGGRNRPSSDPTAVDASVVLSACLGGRKRTRLGMFVPDELAHGQRTNIRGRSASASGLGDALAAGKAVSLTELEEIERKRARAGSVGGPANAAAAAAGRGRTTSVGNQADVADDYYDDEDGEEDEGEDYVMNYYESEGDDGSDGGGEPTF